MVLYRLALLLSLLALSVSSQAREQFLNEWQNIYPNSNSNAAACQLCHVQPNGGVGWNAYGWQVRELFKDNGGNVTAAIAGFAANMDNNGAEDFNSDEDATDASNRTEIDGGFQPGWTEGANNVYFCLAENTRNCNGQLVLAQQLAPSSLAQAILDLDPPARLLNPIEKSISLGSNIELHTVASGFVAPIAAATQPSNSVDLFIADQVGKVWRVNLENQEKKLFLDLSNHLIELGAYGPNSEDERGLLGIAFHPDFASNGFFYSYQSESNGAAANITTLSSNQTANHQSVISEWQVNDPLSTSAVVNPNSKRDILRIDQPQFNNNGGGLSFGPDGLLYASIGDGGGVDDIDGQRFFDGTPMIGHGEEGNGQNASNAYGAIIKIDLETDGYRAHAFGFRNVRQLSFDSQSGALYAPDSAQIGQGLGRFNIGEINQIQPGKHYGWNIKEGDFYFYPNGQDQGYISLMPPDSLAGFGELEAPVFQYDADEGLNTIGGYIYRGTHAPQINGSYIFGDKSISLNQAGGRLFEGQVGGEIKELNITNQNELGLYLHAIAQDERGELYVLGNTTLELRGITGIVQRIDFEASNDELCIPIKSKRGGLSIICL